jgi:hypothetical protein
MDMLLEANGIDPNAATKDEIADAKKAAQDQYLAVAFLLGSDRNHYGKLIENLDTGTGPLPKDSHLCIQSTEELEARRSQHHENHRTHK